MPATISNALIAYLAEESQMCFALQDILQKEGGVANVRMPYQQGDLPDEVWAVSFKKLGVAPELGGPRGVRTIGGTSRQEYSIFTGVAEIRCGLLRTANVGSTLVGPYALIDERLGTARACMLRSAQYFTLGRLPNHVVNDIVEQQATYGVDNTNNRERDYFILPFLITYERRMANFPVA